MAVADRAAKASDERHETATLDRTMNEQTSKTEERAATGTTGAPVAADESGADAPAPYAGLLRRDDVRTWNTPWQRDMRLKREIFSGDLRLWGRLLLTPVGALGMGMLLLVALAGYALGGGSLPGTSASAGRPAASSGNSGGMANMSGMSGMSNSTGGATSSVPDATESYGNQPAPFTLDADGAKHFTLTAQQVMWQPVKGVRLLAWTFGGTVPGPMIHVTAGDHVRITIVNHLPEATTVHWHGLEVQTNSDGVPGVGMDPIKAGQNYTYEFTVHDQDAGTHWYHSHYDDMKQVGGGMYGGFIVDPRPGSAEAQRDVKADVDQTIFIGMLGSYFVMNGKSFPDTHAISVKHGQTVRIRMIGADTTMMHPMHLHGHTVSVISEDGHPLAAPIQKDTVQVAPGETYDMTFTAWAAPGSVFPFHCHILSHVMNPGQTGDEMGGLITLVTYEK